MSDMFLVVGTGVSGIAACQLLMEKEQKLALYDGNAELDTISLIRNNPFLEKVEIYTGDMPEELIDKTTIAVLSPGVPTDLPFVNEMRDKGIKIWGEIELAYRFGKGRIIAITGTNGKTTTTSLVGQIVDSYFESSFVVGNIGIPYTSVAVETRDDSVVVAEISSFQLETIEEFAPKVSAILNITPDHLNRHHTMENYIKAKEDITLNQSTNDVCVLNYEDQVLRKFGHEVSCHVVYFSSLRELESGLYYKDEMIYWAKDGEVIEVIDVKDLNILGLHNYENVMAAVAMAYSIGVPMECIQKTLKEFEAVEHRIEFVCEKRGVAYYNDSKGTNPDAAIKGICAMNRPTYLIGGGYDKDSTYDEWIDSFDGKVKKLYLIGQTAEKIAECCRQHNFNDYEIVETMEEAMDLAYENAKSGEAVLLSPACASWGMFKNYEERGRIFKEYVQGFQD